MAGATQPLLMNRETNESPGLFWRLCAWAVERAVTSGTGEPWKAFER